MLFRQTIKTNNDVFCVYTLFRQTTKTNNEGFCCRYASQTNNQDPPGEEKYYSQKHLRLLQFVKMKKIGQEIRRCSNVNKCHGYCSPKTEGEMD